MRIARGLGFVFALTALALPGCKRDNKSSTKAAPKVEDESTISVAADPGAAARPPPLPAPPDVAEAPSDAVRTPSGLATKVLTPGKGKAHPGSSDRVHVRYTGWTKDGTQFDDSARRGAHATISLGSAIPGWKEALAAMVEGEKRRLWVPAKLAYGVKPAMVGAPAGDLVYDLELVAIVKPPETPSDVKAPPASAKTTETGLAYKTLQAGSGTEHPASSGRVRVHYSGWTKDGKLFDSSVVNGAPATFELAKVVKGFAEGLTLMVVGEKRRLWIPARLAYGETSRPGTPAGDLVFDVELLAIEP